VEDQVVGAVEWIGVPVTSRLRVVPHHLAAEGHLPSINIGPPKCS
jgi:hypothetical protein